MIRLFTRSRYDMSVCRVLRQRYSTFVFAYLLLIELFLNFDYEIQVSVGFIIYCQIMHTQSTSFKLLLTLLYLLLPFLATLVPLFSTLHAIYSLESNKNY